MLSGMKLRFNEDWRTLAWAGLLFPLGPALALWRPALLPWLVPLFETSVPCDHRMSALAENPPFPHWSEYRSLNGGR